MRMLRTILASSAPALALVCAAFSNGRAQEPPSEAPPVRVRTFGGPIGGGDLSRFRDFNEVTKGSQRYDGLFVLHKKDEHLYAEIKPFQFDQAMLAPITIARGLAMAGQPLNFGDEWILVFKRAGDKVQLIRRNIHYKVPAGTPLGKAVQQNYTDSVILALPIVALNPAGGMSVVIDLSDIFFTDFAQLGLGALDRSRTNWHKIKAFPNNLELEVEATFGGMGRRGGGIGGGDDGIADHRGATLVIHYSLARLPDAGYRPRMADDRVGHFLNAIKNFGADRPEKAFDRMVNRWRLEKSDPSAQLSPPKKQVVWWVEDNVPHEYRPFVEQGILEWNKAFEKIGITNALAVRWQAERDEFDPEDINYCTFRWITTNNTFAMSGIRSNPITGEIIDGDVIFDANWIRHWKEEYAYLTGGPLPKGEGARSAEGEFPAPVALAEIISPIMAAKEGFGMQALYPAELTQQAQIGRDAARYDAIPAGWSPITMRLRDRLALGQVSSCQYAGGMSSEFGLAALALADVAAGETKLPDDFIGLAIKEVVMHEVGHSLGLRHNFKASSMLTMDEVNDPGITRTRGMVGSVMDYNPINIVPKGQKQGDFVPVTIGPYDYWAIEYAYKPISGSEADELKKIAARAPEADHVFATDEDMRVNHDPLVNTYDLSSDVLRFARDRMTLAKALIKDLDAKVVKDGESWSHLQTAFNILFQQWGNASYLTAQHIGGQSVARDHKGDKGARDPITPTSGDKQREALRLLVDEVFNDKNFQYSPAILRKLNAEKWMHWGSSIAGGADVPIHERVLAVHRIALGQCLGASTLARLENQELLADQGANPLKISEIFRALTDGIWSEVSAVPGADGKPASVATTIIRRNLQREYLKRLSDMVVGGAGGLGNQLSYLMVVGGGGALPADAKSLARMHLKEIGDKIDKVLDAKGTTIDDVTRAHLEESKQRIAKVLAASLVSGDL